MSVPSKAFVLPIIFIVLVILPASADDDKELDAQLRYEGPGFYSGSGSNSPPIDFESEGVDLLAWLPLGEFDSYLDTEVSRANDIWGYASVSGREYAIIGLREGVAFVEVTVPGDPQIIAAFPGPSTAWRDIKTYKHYAYVVGDGSHRNMQVYDLSRIDDGIVTHVSTVGASRTHNVAIDTSSGMLYRVGSSSPDARGLMIYDLNLDPANPVLVGQWNGHYVHDALAVTYTEGPYAGRQIVFAFTGYNGGLDILDVTDKSQIELVSSLGYTHARYSHQGWLSEDRRYIYLGDEMDERYDPDITTTTTRIIDVADLSNPVEIGDFTNGSSAIDHNLFTRFHLIFEANYRSGLRVFDASDPVEPVEIGYFDTYPNDDSPLYNGLWGNYPYLPSRIVLGSDIEKGLFIWKVYALLEIPLEVDIDIKPGSCPNPLNVKSKGVLPIAILGRAGFDVTRISATSVRLGGVAAIRDSLEDVAGPMVDPDGCECIVSGPDGFVDLTLKFRTQDIVSTFDHVNDGDILSLPLTGVMIDEIAIEGADCIVIRGGYKPINKADINKDGLVDALDLAALGQNWLQSSIVE